ncbi:B-cell receptor-associated protein 31 [Lucilia cuprina]|nr:B-cell receptor-associated protein 31 [Lucilia cuprina]
MVNNKFSENLFTLKKNMSFVWTLIDAFLFTEIVIVLLLVLPVASATRWNRFFKSKFLAMLAQQAQIYIFILIGVLVLFLLEAIREITKFSKQELGEEAQLDMKMQHSMRLFRAQRNFYISGFAIFLVLVIKRLISLISQQAQLLAQSEASLKQAQSASTAVRNIMNENTKVEKAKEAVEDKNVKEKYHKRTKMSLVWTLIAGFLYAEIALVLLLVLPIASPYKWNRFFKSKFLAMLAQQAHLYFFLIMGVLVLFLLDAIREMRKYSHHDHSSDVHLNVEMQHSMRLFRAQRNFYISGFAIFLVLVIRRLVTLISAQANLLAQSEASLKQAQSASAAVKSLMAEKTTEKAKEATEDSTLGEISQLKERIHELTSELNREKKDKEALKSQAESLNKEYDRLTEEFSKLQKKITISGATEGGKGNSKDD